MFVSLSRETAAWTSSLYFAAYNAQPARYMFVLGDHVGLKIDNSLNQYILVFPNVSPRLSNLTSPTAGLVVIFFTYASHIMCFQPPSLTLIISIV